jgi:DNA repair exonuclease SbcCD ATPase subunit
MNRAIIVLLSGVLASAWPEGAAAEGQQAAGAGLAKLMVLFTWSASRFVVPERVVSPEKDWAIVKDAQSERAARIERERELRDARERIAEREHELRLAREAYRRETSRLVQAPYNSMHADAEDRAAQDARVVLAERRLSEREREAYQAKLEYSRAARALREQRRRDAKNAATGG